MSTEEPLGIIGRKRFLIDALGNLLRKCASRHHLHRGLSETRRGCQFDVAILVDDEATGHIARVTIELLTERYSS